MKKEEREALCTRSTNELSRLRESLDEALKSVEEKIKIEKKSPKKEKNGWGKEKSKVEREMSLLTVSSAGGGRPHNALSLVETNSDGLNYMRLRRLNEKKYRLVQSKHLVECVLANLDFLRLNKHVKIKNSQDTSLTLEALIVEYASLASVILNEDSKMTHSDSVNNSLNNNSISAKSMTQSKNLKYANIQQ
jgi:hypothetical protein